MQVRELPGGFESIPTHAQEEFIHNHPALRPNGILAFRHIATGLRVVQFAAPGPLVSATIFVGTKALSNAGHPHTLEHIVFLGSRKHPRGYLDNLACRCLADGTNAWTDNDHTAYTTVTAGFDGFAFLLPAFLDHILRPRISSATFASEVYHVRADGKEAGVVFCEMQARENTEDDLSDNALRKTLLPGTPFEYDSGGLCKEIRHLSNEEVARFHHDQYCTANVSVVVGGTVDSYALLSSVKPLLDEVAAESGGRPKRQVWDSPIVLQPLPKVTRSALPFPCPDEEIGTVMFGWRCPGAVEKKRIMAIDILFRYLSWDVWSPLRQRFVETEDQLASDIYYSLDIFFDVTLTSISFSGVKHIEADEDEGSDEEEDEREGDTDGKLEDEDDDEDDEEEDEEKSDDDSTDAGREKGGMEISKSFLTSGDFEKMVMDCLSNLAKSESLPGGLSAIHAALKKSKESQLAEMESDSHDTIPYDLIDEVVYGDREGLTIGEETRGFLARYKALEKENEAYWIALLRNLIMNSPRAEIVMIPDADLAKKLEEDEGRAVAERIERVGKDELERIGKENEARIESTKAPSFDSEEFPPIPSTVNISRWPYSVARETCNEFEFQSVALETDFVHCTIFLDTSQMTTRERAFLSILRELVPTCDVLLEDGSYIPYTDHSRAISQATTETSESGLFIGYNGGFAHQCGVIHFAASPDSFELATKLTLQSLFHAKVTTERLSAIVQSLHADSTTHMRDGYAILKAAGALLPYITAGKQSKSAIPNFVLANFLGSEPLLTYLSEEVTRKIPRKEVQQDLIQKMHECLNSVRSVSSSNVFVQITAKDPMPAYETVKRLWTERRSAFMFQTGNDMPSLKSSSKELAISRRKCGTLPELLNGDSISRIIGIQGVESSYVEIRVDSPVHNGHADWSALTVLTEMLSRMEGPLSTAVRGAGLAYDVSVSNSRWYGNLKVTISESASPAPAWDAVCKTLQEFREALDQSGESGPEVELQTAKAASLFVLNNDRSTPGSIATGSLYQTALGAPASPLADRQQEEAIEKVTLKCLANAFDRHLTRLLEPANRMAVVTCSHGIVEETIAAFEKCAHPIKLTECSMDSVRLSEVNDLVSNLREAHR